MHGVVHAANQHILPKPNKANGRGFQLNDVLRKLAVANDVQLYVSGRGKVNFITFVWGKGVNSRVLGVGRGKATPVG